MHRYRWLLFLAALLACPATIQGQKAAEPGSSINFRELATKIVKEPAFETKPMYSLLTFGENAQRQHWLVVDGKTIYLDRNGNGDLTDSEDKILLDEKATNKLRGAGIGEYSGMDVFNIGDLEGHTFIYHVWVLNEDFVPKPDEDEMITGWRQDRAKYEWMNTTLYRDPFNGTQTPIRLCPNPKDAQISNFDGLLTFDLKRGDRQCLARDIENVFDLNIGSLGQPTTNSIDPVSANLSTKEVPSEIHPIAEFEFASKSNDSEPIKVVVKLDQRC